MATQPISRRARPAKAPLSLDVIVTTALRILDRDGVDSLTMRRVAQELDTGAASLYVYVKKRDDLMSAILDTVMGEVVLTSQGTWKEQLEELVASAVRTMSRHEGLAVVALGSIPTGLNALLVLDRMLALLKEGGFDDLTAAWAVDLIYLHISAASVEQSAYNTKEMTEAEHIEEVDQFYAALPPDRYPMITSMRDTLLTGGNREHWNLQVLVNGILGTPARPHK